MKYFLVCCSASVLPLYLSMYRYQYGGAILRAADVMSFAVIGLTLLTSPSSSRAFFRPVFAALYVLVGYIVCQSLLQDRLGSGLKEGAQLLFVIASAVTIGVNLERDPGLFLKTFLACAVASLMTTLVYHFVQGYYYRYKFAYDGRYIFGITSATLLLVAWQSRWKFAWLSLFLLSLMPLAASLERTGQLGVATVAVLIAVTSMMKRKDVPISVVLLFALLGGAACSLMWQEDIALKLERVTFENYFVDEQVALFDSNTHRQSLLLNGWDIFSRNWMWGTGADSIKDEMRRYYSDWRLANGTHNFYLDSLIKYGVFGAFVWFGAVLVGFRQTIRQSRNKVPAALMGAYFLFVVTFIAEGAAVSLMFLMPMVIGPLFESSAGKGHAEASHG